MKSHNGGTDYSVPVQKLEMLCEALAGTAMSLEEGCEREAIDEKALTQADREFIDSQVFCCELCSWWSPIDELASDDDGVLVCDDCAG